MAEIKRLSRHIGCELSFVERELPPELAVHVCTQCHLAGVSLQDASQYLENLGVERSHVGIHDWVHRAELQPVSTVVADRVVVSEKLIRVNGHKHWPYGCRSRNELIYLSPFQATRWVLAGLHRRCQLGNLEFLVDGANYLGSVLDEDGHRFQVMSNENRNAVEYIL